MIMSSWYRKSVHWVTESFDEIWVESITQMFSLMAPVQEDALTALCLKTGSYEI